MINHKSRLNCQGLTAMKPMLGKHLAVWNARNPSFCSFKTGLNETPRQHKKKNRRRASRKAIQKAFSSPSLSTQPNRTETWTHFTRGDLCAAATSPKQPRSERAPRSAGRGSAASLTANENPLQPQLRPRRVRGGRGPAAVPAPAEGPGRAARPLVAVCVSY